MANIKEPFFLPYFFFSFYTVEIFPFLFRMITHQLPVGLVPSFLSVQPLLQISAAAVEKSPKSEMAELDC